MKTKLVFTLFVLFALFLAGSSRGAAQGDVSAAAALGTAITYQGRLADGGLSANAAYDFQFTLYNAETSGAQVGSLVLKNDVPVSDGYFTVQLDFGAGAFVNEARWLEVAVRPGANTGVYTVLNPRQALTPAPFAQYAPAAGSAPWSGLTGMPAGFADGVDNDTTYTAGTGLTLSSGQFSLNATYRLPQGCASSQVPKWNGSSWACGDDNGGSAAWSLSGNAGTNPASNYLGTSDNQAFELRVNATRVLRLENVTGTDGYSANLIGGYSGNTVTTGVFGATLFGGVYDTYGGSLPNRITDLYGTVSGGFKNQAGNNTGTVTDRVAATVSGGWGNTASGNVATVGGGEGNSASGEWATVAGGMGNEATNDRATVSGGSGNTASSGAAIGGGIANTAASGATVAGGYWNNASGNDATICGGSGNTASGMGATIGGGGQYTVSGNTASGNYSVIGGGEYNLASAADATVGGGINNWANAGRSTVAGGYSNHATNLVATIGGGWVNVASGNTSTIGGGESNLSSGTYSTVGGGYTNQATNQATTVGGGWVNTASGNAATVPGGANNEASGAYSFAAGADGHATHDGSFVWSSASRTDSWGVQTFTVRAPGGARFYSAAGTTTGVQLAAGGGSFASLSDRNAKFNFSPVNDQQILEKVAALPISTWSYLSQDASILHMGPMAQDFSAAFGLGEDAHYIGTLDAEGVALAAIQGLYRLNQQQAAEIQSLKAQLSQMEMPVSPYTPGNLPLLWVVVVLLGLAQAGMFLVLLRRMRGRS